MAAAALLLVGACDADSGDAPAIAEAAAGETAAAAPAASAEPEGGAAAAAPETAMVGQPDAWGDLVYGAADAPVEVIEYASFTCPACGSWAATVFPQLKEKYIDTGQIRFVFRNFVRDRVDLAAAMVARCSTTDVAKQLTSVFFERQSEWMRSEDIVGALASFARRSGISRVEFDRCLADTDLRDHLVAMT